MNDNITPASDEQLSGLIEQLTDDLAIYFSRHQGQNGVREIRDNYFLARARLGRDCTDRQLLALLTTWCAKCLGCADLRASR